MLIKYVHENLLPGTMVLFIALCIFLCCFLVARKSIEIRSRLSEFLYLFIIVPITITVIYEFFCID